MKLKSLAHIIPLSLPLAFSAAVQAVENLELTDLTHNDPFFYTSDQYIKADNKQKELLGVGRPNTTHSKIPHLPVYYGYMNTNSTYRFVNVVEQVFTMVGEGKHGLWRVQENGTVREYLKVGAKGLAPNADLTATENQKIIKENYSSYLPNESWSGYKYPDQKMNEAGNLNFIDLPISHQKYQGKYAKHQPIDLPNWYCTMSGNDYVYAKQAMNFAFSQKGANQVGPLGQRAGLDVNENYTSVLRLKTMGDGRSWVNVAEKTGDKINVKWEAVDESKTNAEYYLVERPFFNKPYLFVTAIYDNKDNNDHSYVRPKGPYFESIKDKGANLKTKVTAQPRFHLESGKTAKAVGLPIYGVHHPDRAVYGSGGACPLKGGDWGRYPDTSGGAGWPTNYEEVTPLCDSVLLDIKFYANLDGRDWNDPNKYLANAGVGTKEVTYKMQPGTYGEFTDPYNTERGVKNEQSQYVPKEVILSYDKVGEPVSYIDAPDLDLSAIMIPSEATTCRPVIHASLDKEFTK